MARHRVGKMQMAQQKGKLVLNEQDLSSSDSAMRAFGVEDGEHRKLWQATRREIVCLADFIIPGNEEEKVLKGKGNCQSQRGTNGGN